MVKSEEELKNLLMRVKEESEKKKTGLKLNIKKTKIMASSLITSWQIPRDSQESSPTPQFKSINSFALCLLYGSTLTSILGY